MLPEASTDLRSSLPGASDLGSLDLQLVTSRLETDAANAREERGLIRPDLFVVAGRYCPDLRDPGQDRRVTG